MRGYAAADSRVDVWSLRKWHVEMSRQVRQSLLASHRLEYTRSSVEWNHLWILWKTTQIQSVPHIFTIFFNSFLYWFVTRGRECPLQTKSCTSPVVLWVYVAVLSFLFEKSMKITYLSRIKVYVYSIDLPLLCNIFSFLSRTVRRAKKFISNLLQCRQWLYESISCFFTIALFLAFLLKSVSEF